MSAPYRTTPVFDQDTLAEALRKAHSTKAGTWGLIRVLEGQLRLYRTDSDGPELLNAGDRAVCEPQEPHHVEPVGAVRMLVEFHHQPPDQSD